jgi:hypothetical protein
MKRLRNIRRIDDETRRTHGWLTQVQRNNQITTKMFSDGVYGDKHKSMQAALAYRDQVLAEARPIEHQLWIRSVLRRNNSSGIPGVARYDKIANPRTGRREIFWLAFWVDENGVNRKRKFSIFRYGEDKAKQLAVAERERQLQRVCTLKGERIMEQRPRLRCQQPESLK